MKVWEKKKDAINDLTHKIMDKNEIFKLFYYCNLANSVYTEHLKSDNKIYFSSSIDSDVEDELVDFINGLIWKYNWRIEADDTHRWVETDGFYEVEFHLYTEKGSVYINNKSGDNDLQEEWSENNPQNLDTIADCYMYSAWDWYYFLDGLIKEYDLSEDFCDYVLATDFCKYGNFDLEKSYNAIKKLVESGKYTIEQLKEMNDDDDLWEVMQEYYNAE